MENSNVIELNKNEMLEISGGKIPWGKIKELGQKAWNAITATDAYLSFKEGWDSVECE